jgi:hypothetical protein
MTKAGQFAMTKVGPSTLHCMTTTGHATTHFITKLQVISRSQAAHSSIHSLKRFGTDTTSVTTVWFTLHRYSFCCIWRAQPNTHINAWDDNTSHIC